MTDLDKIRRAVEAQLEEKRKQFSRFYFLSTDELLDLLSEQDKIEVVTDGLKKFFDNIQDLHKSENQNQGGDKFLGQIKGLISGENEILTLQKFVEMTATTQINQWLNEMQDGMIASLKTYM